MRFSTLASFADRIDRLTTAVGRTVAWLALVVVLLEFALVLARYVFALGSIWATETVIYAHATLFLLAAAWTLKAGGHVRVDVFYSDASPRTKASDGREVIGIRLGTRDRGSMGDLSYDGTNEKRPGVRGRKNKSHGVTVASQGWGWTTITSGPRTSSAHGERSRHRVGGALVVAGTR